MVVGPLGEVRRLSVKVPTGSVATASRADALATATHSRSCQRLLGGQPSGLAEVAKIGNVPLTPSASNCASNVHQTKNLMHLMHTFDAYDA